MKSSHALRTAAIFLVSSLGLGLRPEASYAAITLLSENQWKLSLLGRVEMDFISDSTRGLQELVGSGPVARPDTVNGQTGRMLFSLRNSKLGFRVEAPPVGDWKTQGAVVWDFGGINPQPGALNSEASFSNDATARFFLGYIRAENDEWNILAGLYWSGFAWQPNYFMSFVSAVPFLGSRKMQVRAVRTFSFANDDKLQALLEVIRPPQQDAGLPGLQAGARYAFGSRTAGFRSTTLSDHVALPASVAVSGDLRQFAVPSDPASPNANRSRVLGAALAVNALLPVIASRDDKDPSNTLTVSGEFSMGTGYGDELFSWTGNLANPLNSSASSPSRNVNLDGGIGDFDTAGNFHLVNLKSFAFNGEFHFDERIRTWVSAGYGRVYSDNVNLLTNSAGVTSVGSGTQAYDKVQIYFVNAFHDLSHEVRAALEFSHIRSDYADNIVGRNNRYQLMISYRF